MSNSNEAAQIEKDLIELGLTLKAASEIASTWVHSFTRHSGHWITFFAMVGGFVLGALFIWQPLELLSLATAIIAAYEAGAWSYIVNFGLSILLLLFIWIFTSGILPGIVTRLTPMPWKGALYLGALSDKSGGWWYARLTRQVIEKLEPQAEASRIIDTWALKYCSALSKFVIPMLLLSGFLLVRDVGAHSLYGPDGYTSSPFLPWANIQTIPWSEAVKVELGCNNTDDGADIVYEVTFSNGKSTRVENGSPLQTSWLETLERVDAEISKSDVQFERWSWLNRNPLHPKCVRSFYSRLGEEDADRLMALLRVGQFESDKEHLGL